MLAVLQAPQVDVPPNSFALVSYGAPKDRQTILGRAAAGGYGDLRQKLLPTGDAEIRVWGGFGTTFLQGTILRRVKGTWIAVRLLSETHNGKRRDWTKVYTGPKAGWPTFWSRAESLGIWTLPDDSTLPQEGRQTTKDGYSIIVETQRAGKYRVYAYNNPKLQTQWPTAARIMAIGKLLGAEFPVGLKG